MEGEKLQPNKGEVGEGSAFAGKDEGRPRERKMGVQEGEDGNPEEGGRVDRDSERVWGRKFEKDKGEKKIVTE